MYNNSSCFLFKSDVTANIHSIAYNFQILFNEHLFEIRIFHEILMENNANSGPRSLNTVFECWHKTGGYCKRIFVNIFSSTVNFHVSKF